MQNTHNTTPLILSNVQLQTIAKEAAGQRIDNYLLKQLHGVPKSHVYRLLRKGQVRVNKGRIKPVYKLKEGDVVRIPPIHLKTKEDINVPDAVVDKIFASVVHEDDELIIFNKPAGIAVHVGTGVHFGLIDAVRQYREESYWELVHRLDRDTSGCLLVAKSRAALNRYQDAFKQRIVDKQYLALLVGDFPADKLTVDKPLQKNNLQGGERMVCIDQQGRHAVSHFERVKQYKGVALVKITIETGRTHQIRVHAASLGHPVLGDDKYGNKEQNKYFRQHGLKRMYLHAQKLHIHLEEESMAFEAQPDSSWLENLDQLNGI